MFIVSRSPLPTRKGIPIYIRIITKDLTSFANSFWVLVFSSWSLVDVLDLDIWEQFSNYWIILDISDPYSSISLMIAYFLENSPSLMDRTNWIIIISRFSVVIQNLNAAQPRIAYQTIDLMWEGFLLHDCFPKYCWYACSSSILKQPVVTWCT